MKNNKKKIVSTLKGVLVFLFLLAAGGLMGMLSDGLGLMNGAMEADVSVPAFIAVLVLAFVVVYYLGIAVHEAGHLVFGLLTGYTFVSYRLLSFDWVKLDGKLRLKRFKLAGTGGQCLMAPPAKKADGSFPFVLYNLGGVLFNMLTVMIAVALAGIFPHSLWVSVFSTVAVVFSASLALSNGIPLVVSGVPNDGYNALMLGKDPKARDAFWTVLKVNALTHEGMRLRDMPAEWFVFPEKEDLGNGMTASAGALAENRMMDMGDLDGAARLAELLLADGCGAAGVYKHLAAADLVFCRALESGRDADVSPVSGGQAAAFLKKMKDLPSVLRTRYALVLLKDGDEKKAEEIRRRFEKVALTYPAASEIESERELMDMALARAEAGPRA